MMNLQTISRSEREHLASALTEAARRNFFLNAARERKAEWRTIARPEQLPPPGDWLIWLIEAGRGWGKALALDTPVPTQEGWSTMGALRIGDSLFDEQGASCTVTYISPIYIGRPCYEVLFSDGTRIVADADHEWLTWDRRTRKAYSRAQSPQHQPHLVTTREIADSIYDAGEVNHAIPCAQPLSGTERTLPIAPYTLGAWLGDGDSKGAVLTCAAEDVETLNYIAADGYAISRMNTRGAPRWSIGQRDYLRDPRSGQMVANGSLHSLFKASGLLHNKHIPDIYLRASYSQRFALVQGLMDTDGYAEANGNCEFTTTNQQIADGVYELLMTLGVKATVAAGRATLYGMDCGAKYRISFTPYLSVFRLTRKAARLHTAGAQSERQLRKYIVSAQPVPSVAVRCIQVDSPSHLFLVSKSMIPTHNTRTGAEWLWEQAKYNPRVAIVAPTFGDGRDTCIEGETGIKALHPELDWNRSIGEMTFPSGARGKIFSGEEPERLRGPNNYAAWCDEFSSWRYQKQAFDMLMFTLRKGESRCCITTTPKKSKLLAEIETRPTTVLVRRTTYDNIANLSRAYIENIIKPYEGTRLGRQELEALVLDDEPGALWKRETIEQYRVTSLPEMERIVVGVDPTGTENGDEAGIIVDGRARLYGASHLFTLDDLSLHGTPQQWGSAVVAAYNKWRADLIVAEANYGGEMVAAVIHNVDPSVPVRLVHASRGKYVRAEPISTLCEQGREHHVGVFAELEDELCQWVQGMESPNRMDAHVWAATSLMLGETPQMRSEDVQALQNYRG